MPFTIILAKLEMFTEFCNEYLWSDVIKFGDEFVAVTALEIEGDDAYFFSSDH